MTGSWHTQLSKSSAAVRGASTNGADSLRSRYRRTCPDLRPRWEASSGFACSTHRPFLTARALHWSPFLFVCLHRSDMRQSPFVSLNAHFFKARKGTILWLHLTRNLVRRLERLGYTVTLNLQEQAA